jgi:hypothetical protein
LKITTYFSINNVICFNNNQYKKCSINNCTNDGDYFLSCSIINKIGLFCKKCRTNPEKDGNINASSKNSSKKEALENEHKKYYSSNKYNPSAGNFLPYLPKEMQNIIKILKIDSLKYKIPNEYQYGLLRAVIDCILYYHYNSTGIEILKNFFFEFNQKLENPLEKEELEKLWIEQTAFIEVDYGDKKKLSPNPNLNNNKKGIQKKKDATTNKKANQKKYAKSSKPSKNIIEYEKLKEKLLFLHDFKPSIEQNVKCLKLMYELLCKELGFLSEQEIIDKIFIDTAAEIRLSKKQIQRLVLKEGFYVY